MLTLIKKISIAILSVLIGLILIPILSLEKLDFEYLPILIIYFLPGSVVGILIIFEVIRILEFIGFYNFIQSGKMLALFLILLLLQWIIQWKVDGIYDIVFFSQFATATIPSIWIYCFLGKKLRFLK